MALLWLRSLSYLMHILDTTSTPSCVEVHLQVPQTCTKGLSSPAQVTHCRHHPAWGQPSAHTTLQGLRGLPQWDHL